MTEPITTNTITTTITNNNIDYKSFLQQILKSVHSARYEMLREVSKKMVLLYWDIGRFVSEEVNGSSWGKSIVEQLSKDLQKEFSGIRGFSARNIWRMKVFYEFYQQHEKLTPLVAEIGWVQNCLIIEKCKDILQVEYYLKKTQQMGWSKLDLIDKINNHYFENQILVQNNFSYSVPEQLKSEVMWEFIDDYNIELINPDMPFSEKELENTIIKNIVDFLFEMGGHFAFIGRQYKLEFHEKEYFVDLLFFNIKLNCYVVFELKAREFEPKDIGQVKWYMELVNEQIKENHHNPTIGIILCKNKDRLMVEYMLKNTTDPVGIATYNRYQHLPQEYAKFLPNEEEIINRLSNIV